MSLLIHWGITFDPVNRSQDLNRDFEEVNKHVVRIPLFLYACSVWVRVLDEGRRFFFFFQMDYKNQGCKCSQVCGPLSIPEPGAGRHHKMITVFFLWTLLAILLQVAPYWWNCYQTKFGAAWLHLVKPIYWHQVAMKQNVLFIAGAKQVVQAASLKNLASPVCSGEDF